MAYLGNTIINGNLKVINGINVSGNLTGNVTGNCSGTAANVTGTVAIAHGGTGATTRLAALQALTNENVSTSAQYFLTITSSWGKGGYTTVADAKTVLGLKSAAYTESSAYAAKSHGNHVPTTQTASNKVFLRNDNTWQTVTPANIGAAASSHTHNYIAPMTNVSELGRYIDFHYDNATAKYDYDVRLQASSQGSAAGGGVFSITAARIDTNCYINSSGNVVATNYHHARNGTLVKGKNPSSVQYSGMYMCDKNGTAYGANALGLVETSVATNGVVSTYIRALKNEANSTVNCQISACIDASGNAYTAAPTPATSDNSTKIATTAYVKAQGYTTATGHTHSYLPLSGGTLTGALTLHNSGSGIVWRAPANIQCTATAKSHEWSFDLTPGSYTGTYWHVYSSKLGKTILQCFTDNCNVSVPNGTFTAVNVYNAVYNDYAEFFPRGEETEPGDVIALDLDSDKEQYVKSTANNRHHVVGVHSDDYAMIIGGDKGVEMKDNEVKYIPVSLMGRIKVKYIGAAKKGNYVVASEIRGVARAYDKNKDSELDIFGFLLEEDDKVNEVRRLKIKVKG